MTTITPSYHAARQLFPHLVTDADFSRESCRRTTAQMITGSTSGRSYTQLDSRGSLRRSTKSRTRSPIDPVGAPDKIRPRQSELKTEANGWDVEYSHPIVLQLMYKYKYIGTRILMYD